MSQLTRAKIWSGDLELASSVDAMAGCSSGQIVYVTASEGGIAGAGETLRRIAWDDLRFEDDRFVTKLGKDQFEKLAPIPKEEWPSR